MADGKVSLPYKHFLGYRKGADGLPEIVPEEAEIVRNIYRWFMEGKTPTGIARTLTEQGVPTPAGKEQWCSSTVKSILTNEKYKGSALLQKRFTVDFLTKKSKVNEGEVPQYYRNLNWCRQNCCGGKTYGGSTMERAYLLPGLSAVTVEISSEQRSGIPTANTGR